MKHSPFSRGYEQEADSRKQTDSHTLEWRKQMETLQQEFQILRFDNDRYRSKCEELEKWVVTLTNSFYEGNTQSLQTMDWAVKSLEA